VHVNLYEYWDLVRDSSVITQQISTVALFVGTFFHVYYNSLSEYMLLATNAVCAVVGIGLLYVSGASTESMSQFGLRATHTVSLQHISSGNKLLFLSARC